MNKDYRQIALILIVAVLVLVTTHEIFRGDRYEIRQWVTQRGEVLQDIDQHFFTTGPYWYVKGARIYRVTTDRNVYWFRYNFGRKIRREYGDAYEMVEN